MNDDAVMVACDDDQRVADQYERHGELWVPAAPQECEQRSPFARAFQGAWDGCAPAFPRGPYGHLCDATWFKCVSCLGWMLPCDIPPRPEHAGQPFGGEPIKGA